MQFVELAIAARNHPCCRWHLIAGFAFDLDNVCANVSNVLILVFFCSTLTHGILLSILLSTNHDRLYEYGGATIQTVIALLNDVLLPL